MLQKFLPKCELTQNLKAILLWHLCPALNSPSIVALSVIRASAVHLRQPDLKPNWGICAALRDHATCERSVGLKFSCPIPQKKKEEKICMFLKSFWFWLPPSLSCPYLDSSILSCHNGGCVDRSYHKRQKDVQWTWKPDNWTTKC